MIIVLTKSGWSFSALKTTPYFPAPFGLFDFSAKWEENQQKQGNMTEFFSPENSIMFPCFFLDCFQIITKTIHHLKNISIVLKIYFFILKDDSGKNYRQIIHHLKIKYSMALIVGKIFYGFKLGMILVVKIITNIFTLLINTLIGPNILNCVLHHEKILFSSRPLPT